MNSDMNCTVRGDDKHLPNRGTGTGMVSNPQTHGKSLATNATNRMGGIVRETRSDPPSDRLPNGDK